MPVGFLAEAHRGQFGVADHQVARDERHLDGLFPFAVELRAGADCLWRIVVLAFLAICLHPLERFLVFGLIENAAVHAAEKFRHVNSLNPHAKMALEERLVHNRAGNAHRHAAHAEIRLAAHRRHGQTGAGELQNLRRNIGGDHLVGAILDIAPVNPESWQSLLRVAGQHGGEIDRAGPLGAVEPPNRLGHRCIHVHGFAAVAPARRHGQRQPGAFAREFFRARGGLAVGMAQPFANEFHNGLGEVHRLRFQRFADAAAPSVNGRADADFGEFFEQWIFHNIAC